MSQDLKYDESVADQVCERIIGGESLLSISKDPQLPAQSTIYKWLLRVPEFAEKYARAREAQMEAMAEDILQIADDTGNDTKYVGENGTPVADNEWISRSKLRVDTRKWLMSKLAPKKYGDKQQVALTDPEGGPLQIISTVPRPAKE